MQIKLSCHPECGPLPAVTSSHICVRIMFFRSFSRGELWLGTSFTIPEKPGFVFQLGIQPPRYHGPVCASVQGYLLGMMALEVVNFTFFIEVTINKM